MEEDERLPQVPPRANLPDLYRENRIPSAPEGTNIDNGPFFRPLGPQSVTSAPTPSTAMSALGNLDTFIQSLTQELLHSPNASVKCAVKQNDEPMNFQNGPLEQRLEKKMNVQLSITPPAADQRIILPVSSTAFTSGASEPQALFLSLVIAGQTTRRIFGGVGLYHPNQSKPELLNIVQGPNFSPVVAIASGRTVCIGFKFATYPRQWDPSEDAFRVVVTIHDRDGKLVAYNLSAFAYSVKSHPRKSKRSQRASTDDSEGVGNSRTKRRRANPALATTSSTSMASTHALSSSSATAGSSGQRQPGGSANISGHPVVERAVDQSEGMPPMIDPQLQPLPHEPYDTLPLKLTEGDQPVPTLDEAVPPSCSWRGGIYISLFVNNLPHDGRVYARFGLNVVKTDRKNPHVLACRVPPATGPCEVEVTLSRGSGPFDAPYGMSLCKFTYEEDDTSRLVRSLKAEAQGSESFAWQAATAIQDHATRHRLIPSQSHTNQSTHALVPWSGTTHARLEVVEEGGEGEKTTGNVHGPRVESVQAGSSNIVPSFEMTSHDPSDMMEEIRGDAGVESGGRTEGQVTIRLDPEALDGPENHTTPRATPNPTSDTPNPVIPNLPESLPPGRQSHQQGSPDPAYIEPPTGVPRTSQQPLEHAPPTDNQYPNLPRSTSPPRLLYPTIPAQIISRTATPGFEPPPISVLSPMSSSTIDSAHGPGLFAPSHSATYQGPSGFARSQVPLMTGLVPPPTSTITSTPVFSVEDSVHEPALFAMPGSPPLEVPQSVNLNHFYDDVVHKSYRNTHLKCLLKDPKDYQQNRKITVRREKRVVLELHLQAEGGRIREMGWQGIALLRTGSVKQSNQLAPAGLLHFSIGVHGSTTGMSLTQPCANCWQREMRFSGNVPGLQPYLIDFKSDSPFILFPRSDTRPYIKAEVTFHFTCYSRHQKEDYELVARLHDEQGDLVAYYQIPYSFNCVANGRGGGLQDDYPSIVPPVVSPVAASMPLAAGHSPVLHTTDNFKRTANSPQRKRPALEVYDRTGARRLVPPSHHTPMRGNVDARPSLVDIGSHTVTNQLETHDQPLLQKIIPIEGPTRGGLNIVLIGTNLPPWPTTVYARFGTAVAATSWINPYTLECVLPNSPNPGLVDVTFSLSPDKNAPQLGRSLCTFTYRDEQESFLLMLRSIYGQGHELSHVALDILVPQVLQHASSETLNHALRRLAPNQGDRPPIDDRELEELGVRFLASISHPQNWSIILSLAGENHQTFAHLCVFTGCTGLLAKVVDWGIDLDVQDISGWTALHYAYLHEDWGCVQVLKDAGANEYIMDKLGRIPRMCQHIESEGAGREATSSSMGEDWLDVSRISASPEDFTLHNTRMILPPPRRNPSDITSGVGIDASPMPIPGPPSEGSSNADDESWMQAFNSIQISESPPPLARAPSSITSSSSKRRNRAPRYGWSHPPNPPPSPGLQQNMSSGAPARFYSLPATSSFDDLAPALSMPNAAAHLFPVPKPAVPFPIAEPAMPFPTPEPVLEFPVLEAAVPWLLVPEEINEHANSLGRQLSLQRGSPRVAPSLIPGHHNPAQTPPSHGPHATLSNLPDLPPRSLSPDSIQQPHHRSKSVVSIGYDPLPCLPPPPPQYSSSEGVLPSSPPHLPQYRKTRRRRYGTSSKSCMSPSADQEK